MTLPGLFSLLVILTCSDAANPDPACSDCNLNGPWWPLFRPSQIIHSEFPEHARLKSLDRQFVVDDSSSHEQRERGVLRAGRPAALASGSGETNGFDSRVKTYNSQGKHRVEWDHYGDVSRVTTASYNSLEERSSPNRVTNAPYNSVEERGPPSRESEESRPSRVVPEPEVEAAPNSVEVARAGVENTKPEGSSSEGQENKDDEDSEKDASVIIKSQEGSFFEEGSFFDEKPTSKKGYSEEFEISKEGSYSGEADRASNSIEFDSSLESFGMFRRPVATSYASISSVFTPSRPVPAEARDLLHPDLINNDIPNYFGSQADSPMSRTHFYNGKNTTQQYLVHENTEDPGTLIINHNHDSPLGRSSQPPPFVPLTHPVYRYVKNHGGLMHQYRREPLSRSTSSLRWQDIHPELQEKFPFNNLQPNVRIQNHETLVHHVVPTKDTFDSFFKDSKRVERFKSPPFGENFYLLKKRQNAVEYKKFGRRQGHNFVYIIRKNKRLS